MGAAWPNIPPPDYTSGGETYLPQLADEKEAGYVSRRKRFTRAREIFQATWNLMDEADFQTLKSFFIMYQAGAVDYPDPVTGTIYECAFIDDSLRYSLPHYGVRSVSVKLEEI